MRWRLGAIVVLLAALVVVVWTSRGGEDGTVVSEVEASGACDYDTTSGEDPPASGEVAEVEPAPPGFYELDDEPPADRALLRSMRQGFVVLWYAPAADPDTLRGLSDRFGRDLIVVPRPGLATPFAVTAWERRALCSSADEGAIAAFVEGFRDRGPEKGFL